MKTKKFAQIGSLEDSDRVTMQMILRSLAPRQATLVSLSRLKQLPVKRIGNKLLIDIRHVQRLANALRVNAL